MNWRAGAFVLLAIAAACHAELAVGGPGDDGGLSDSGTSSGGTSSSGGSSNGSSSSGGSGGTSSGSTNKDASTSSSSGGSPQDAGCQQLCPLPDGASYNANLPSGLDGATTVADLSDAQAEEFCVWLNSLWGPNGCGLLEAGAPGFIGGGASSSYQDPNTGETVELDCLDPADCVLNLRQAPCSAPLSYLPVCLKAFFNMPIHDALPINACQPWNASPGCAETVVRYDASTCVGMLPIAPGATCP
jgi:hypothetical protein